MLLAIDVGNSHIVFGHYDNGAWQDVLRFTTSRAMTEDELAATYFSLRPKDESMPDDVVCASVVPMLDVVLERFSNRWLGRNVKFLTAETVKGLAIEYSPPDAVGADRLANALAIRAKYPLPAIGVDFGTATTFDVIGRNGEYLGGTILPGPNLLMNSLSSNTARLPIVDLVAPRSAIGKTTAESIQAGLVLGYANAIDGLLKRMQEELSGVQTIIATGGLAHLFASNCHGIQGTDELLTLDGLRLFADD